MGKIQPKKKTNFTVTEQEQALSQLKKTDRKKDMIRTTLDLPPELHSMIEEEVKNNGQTIRGFFITLARKHFEEKQLK